MFTRRVLHWCLALGLVLWSVQATQGFLRQQQRRELNRRLRRALEEGDWEPVAKLLRQGADPRTRDAEGHTALLPALRAGDVPATRLILTARRSEPWIVAQELPWQPTRALDPLHDQAKVEETLAAAVSGPGSGLVNGWLGLAQLRSRSGKYGPAAEAYRRAEHLGPGCLDAGLSAEKADAAAAAAQRMAAYLPAGMSVLQTEPVGTWRDATLWATFYAGCDEFDQLSWVSNPHVQLFAQDSRGLYPVGAARQIPIAVGETYNSAGMFVRDLTGDRVPELAIELTSTGGGAAPACLEILSVSQGKLRSLLQLESDAPVWIEDLDGDGRYEAANAHRIGDELASVEMPWWNEIYAFDGHQYVPANQRSPREFQEWRETLEAIRAKHPGDAAIVDYLGRTYEILGRKQDAAACYQCAERILRSQSGQSQWGKEYQARLPARLRALRQRLRSLQGAIEPVHSKSDSTTGADLLTRGSLPL